MRMTTTPLLVGIAIASFATTLAQVPAGSWLSTASLSLGAGVTALAMMGFAALLGSRWAWIEDAFGGLDRVYEVHKWLGVWALVLASVHVLFKAGAPGWDVAAILPLPPVWTRFVRQASYVALVAIVVLALNRNIPYASWRWWHKLSGPLFLVVVLHWLSFRSPIALGSAAGLWLAACAVLGVAGALYKLVLYRFVSPHREYRLESVTPGPESVELAMRPVDGPLGFEAGQFGFLRLLHPGLREPHPFTIASAPGPDGRVRFLVRALGDYTARLVAEARPGMRAEIHAPFGRFRRPEGGGTQAWIAGGVGLSPFVAWLDDPAAADLRGVVLFDFQTPGREFPGIAGIAARARAKGVEWIDVRDGPDSSAFRARFAELARTGSLRISFCGPAGLLAHVRAAMARLGIPADRLQYERFGFR